VPFRCLCFLLGIVVSLPAQQNIPPTEVTVQPIPNVYERLSLITNWVENGKAPGKSVFAIAGERSMPMCSYPEYPKYSGGPTGSASSYTCAAQ